MLDEIIENKLSEVEINKNNRPLAEFKNQLKKSQKDFKKAISKNKLNLIAEIKRKSPSHKKAFNDFDLRKIAGIYGKHADAISVLTDEKFFSGSLEDLKKISEMTNLPILRKDFIIDLYQIYEARLFGADAILLIASVLSLDEINNFIGVAKSLGMDCLVEVHNKKELDKVLNSKAEIIGINNRNLDTLEIDLNMTLNVMSQIPDGKIIVSESGISSKEYISKIKSKVNAILIGTLFMESKNIEKEILSLIK